MIKSAWRETRTWRHLAAFAFEVPRRLFEDRLTQSAGSLTYTTLLAIVPLLTVALSLATAFPVFDQAVGGLQDYFVENFLPDAGLDVLTSQVDEFTARAGSLTAIGLGALAVTAVMLMLTIDDTLNRIFRVERKRPLLQRLAMYWAVLTLGPLLIGLGLSMTTALVVNSFGKLNLDRAAELVLRGLPFLLTWAALTSLYILVPNRAVRPAHALLGGFFAGVAFEIAKRGVAVYVSNFPTYTIIYGTFATVLIFLLWLYVSWLVVLAGATFTAMLTERSKILETYEMRTAQ
jgi:membrane protein